MVWYGLDYSARELAPSELDGWHDYDVRFLLRYIGYPDNPKCVSHYPGAYAAHRAANRVVLLVHENDRDDVARGHDGGVADAQRAEADRRNIGAPDNAVIFFCADRWLGIAPAIPVETAMAYLDGAASVLGHDRVGAYGFRDFVAAAHAGGHASWFWLCGAAPTDDEVRALNLHVYQCNNEQESVNGLDGDLDWSYVSPDTIVGSGTPGQVPPLLPPVAPPWPLPKTEYFGLITGPRQSHGGFYAKEQPSVREIQQALIRKGYVPGISDPNSRWADGIFEQQTADAVARFQHAEMPGTTYFGQVWRDDWAKLLS